MSFLAKLQNVEYTNNKKHKKTSMKITNNYGKHILSLWNILFFTGTHSLKPIIYLAFFSVAGSTICLGVGISRVAKKFDDPAEYK